jgi:glycosyltransferase involved in cell wall biosynthesis
MNNLPKFTIVTPCLNAAATIERTLLSVQSQYYENLQYIICDGGSTDGTLEIINGYKSIVTHLISGKDKNVANALNKGFARATGDLYGYINADDVLGPGALHHAAAFFKVNPDVDVFTGGCRRVFADGSQIITQVPDEFLDVLAMKDLIEQPSTFWRADINRRAGSFDETYYLAFDWEYWNRLHKAGARFARTDKVLSTYYFSGDNLTSRASLRTIDEMYRVTKTYARNPLLADVYTLLFKVFDMRGFYDKPFWELSRIRQILFGSTLVMLCKLFGRTEINSYNWNWVSKQLRNIVWYK